MRRHRPHIVWLCLLALVWCQVAMASQVCHGGGGAGTTEAPADCHGAGATAPDPAPPCPGSDVVPDLGKLPTVAPLPAGLGYTVASSFHRPARGLAKQAVCAREGPHLDALCRLLI